MLVASSTRVLQGTQSEKGQERGSAGNDEGMVMLAGGGVAFLELAMRR